MNNDQGGLIDASASIYELHSLGEESKVETCAGVAVTLFSKVNQMFLGYFDPINTIFW